MITSQVVDWLLDGDVSIQYQTYRDLVNSEESVIKQLQAEISEKGWGRQFLDKQKDNFDWGNKFYHPKWTCTHYTLLDLKTLGMLPNDRVTKSVLKSIHYLRTSRGVLNRELCVHGMLLNYSSHFGTSQELLIPVIDFLLDHKMSDNAWNCEFNRKGAKHSSLHTTISVLEGLFEFIKSGNEYRKKEIRESIDDGVEFILKHELYKSCKTKEIISPKLLKLSFPTRWYYNTLRALDFFQYAEIPRDPRMEDALVVLMNKEKSGKWPFQQRYPGQFHFEMETVRQPSRWNTLRALRVLKQYPVG
ncbi:MAG: hypothetical protein ACW98K_15315 [Candidatus Kariarchaeaceae archaeon]|jgi:hypothetical protein